MISIHSLKILREDIGQRSQNVYRLEESERKAPFCAFVGISGLLLHSDEGDISPIRSLGFRIRNS